MLDILDKVLFANVTVKKLLVMMAILLGLRIISNLLSFYLRKSLKTKMNKDHLELIIKIVTYSLFTIVASWLLGLLGIELSGLLVAGGILGIVIGFASQSIVGNLVSGLFLMMERPMKIGNAVEVNGTVGIVEDIKIISTKIRTWDGLDIRIPNEKVFTSSITNYVSNVARRFNYKVGIRYQDDADKAIRIIKELIDNEPFALHNPEPVVFVSELNDSSVDITVMIWGPVSEWYQLKMKMLWEIKKVLEENEIEIAFPQSVIWLGEKELKIKQ